MKLSIVTSGLDFGGAETQIAALAPRLAAKGWQTTVVSLQRPGKVGDALMAAGIDVVDLALPGGVIGVSSVQRVARNGATYLRLAGRLVRVLNGLSPDIVHSHMVPANLLSRIVRPFVRPKALVCTAHSIIEIPAWKTVAYRLTDRLCDVTTNICRAGVERSIRDGRVPAGRVVHVPNGVDTERFRHDPDARARLRGELEVGDRFVWLAAGRLSWEKDWPTMIGAFAALPGDSLLLVAGEGPLLDETRAAAGAAGLSNRMRFLGVRQDLDRLMSAADGFVMSSSVEGLPMVLLEASACGLPIVATDVGGVSEIVDPGVTGLLVKPECPEELAASLARIEAFPPEEREALGHAGRDRMCREYDLDRIVTLWEELYLALIGGREWRRA